MYQTTIFQVVADNKRRRCQYPQTSQSGSLQRIAIVGVQTAVQLDELLPAVGSVKQQFGIGSIRINEAIVFGQVLRNEGLAMAFEVRRRGTKDEPARRETPGDKAGVFHLADSNRYVKSFIDQINEPVIENHFYGNLLIYFKKFVYRWSQMEYAEANGGIDPKCAARPIMHQRDGGFGGFGFLYYPNAVFKERGPDLRQAQTPSRTVE